MAYTITSQCISCDRCHSQCPTGAIQLVDNRYQIDPNLCNNCVGYYGVAQCAAGCPTSQGCVPSLSNFLTSPSNDYWDAWFQLHDRLVARLYRAKHTNYWQQWFEAYSQKLAECNRFGKQYGEVVA